MDKKIFIVFFIILSIIVFACKPTILTFSVTYNSNGSESGNVPEDNSNYTEGSSVSVMGNSNNLIKSGFNFAGWNTKANGIGQSYNEGDSFIIQDSDVILYAQWTEIPTYSVIYDPNGAESGDVPIDSNEYLEGDTATVFGNDYNLSKTGFLFRNWNTEVDGSGETFSRGKTIIISESDVTLYAQWFEVLTYSVTYVLEEGTGTVPIDTNEYHKGDKVTVLDFKDYSYPDFNFAGWMLEMEGSESILNVGDDFIMGVSDVELKAFWTAYITHLVTFESNGGSDINSQSITDGHLAIEPAEPTKIGHTFGGWFEEEELINQWNFSSDTVTSDVTLYAKWTINEYNVDFESYEGTAIDPQTIQYGELVTEPADPTKTGHTFGGWFEEEEFINQWDFSSDTVISDMTLYAKWTIIGYTVDFESYEGTAVDSQTIEHGGLVTEPAEPTKIGHTFDGWYKEEGFINLWNFASDTVISDVTLYAKWTIIEYTVDFESYEGTAVDSQTIEHGGLVIEPADPSRDGYLFDGWFEEEGFINQWNFTSDTVISDMTLYAKWFDIMEANDDTLLDADWNFYADRTTSFSVTNLTDNDINFVSPGGLIEVISVSDPVNGSVELVGTTINFTGTTAGSPAEFTYTARVVYETVNYEETARVTIENIESTPPVIAGNDGPYSMNQSAEMVISATDLLANDLGEDGTNNNIVFVGLVASSEVNVTVSLDGNNITVTSTGPAYTAAEFQYEIQDTTSSVTAIGTVFFDIGPLPPQEAFVFIDAVAFNDFKATNTPATFSEIFNTWGRFDGGLIFADKTEADAHGSTAASDWLLIDEGLPNERVLMPTNVTTGYNGLFSDELVENYTFEATLYSNDNDNDSISLIIAYTEESGTPYALSAVRTGTGASPVSGWGVIEGNPANTFDHNGDVSGAVVESKSLSGQRSNWGGYYTRVKIERNGDIVKVWTTDFTNTQSGALSLSYLPESLIEIDLSSDTRFEKYRGAKSYGYGTFSQSNSTYLDVEFTGGLDTETTIMLTDGVDTDLDGTIDRWNGSEVWKYEGSQWVLKTGVTVQDELGFPREVTFPSGNTYFIRENYVDLVID